MYILCNKKGKQINIFTVFIILMCNFKMKLKKDLIYLQDIVKYSVI